MADKNGNGGGQGFYGIGRIPSVQTKVEEKSEFGLLLRYFWGSTLTIEAIQVLFYIVINTFLKGWDWYAILWGIFLTVGGAVTYKVFTRVGDITYVTAPGCFAIVAGLVVTIGLPALVVPVIVKTLEFPEGADLISSVRILFRPFALSLFISVTLSGLFLVYRSWRELSDPFHSPEGVVIEREKWKGQIAVLREQHRLKELPGVSNMMPVMLRAAPKSRAKLDAREINKRAIIAFVIGLSDKSIGITEDDWNTHASLADSGRILTKGFGIIMRNFLIEAGWLEWRDETNHNLGIQFNPNYEVDEILDEIGGLPKEQFTFAEEQPET